MLQALDTMKWLAVVFGLFPLAQQVALPAPAPPPNEVAETAPDVPAQPFDAWLQDVIDEARSRGFSDRVVDETLKGLEPLPRVIARDRSQAELRPGFTRYSSSHLTTAMVRRGRELSHEHRSTLSRIEGDYEVQRRFVLAIWGGIGALAVATGPSLGAAIVSAGGWRWAFFVNLPVSAIVLLG